MRQRDLSRNWQKYQLCRENSIHIVRGSEMSFRNRMAQTRE
jgi:hypothetical protein